MGRMPRLLLLLAAIFLPFLLSFTLHAQWAEQYATYDDETNGTGNQTISVAVVGENTFVAVVTRVSRIYGPGYSYSTGANSSYDDVNAQDSVSMNYLVGFIDADSALGRVSNEPYGGVNVGRFKKWVSFFDEIPLWRAYKVVGSPDSLIYVSNNDPQHNVLVFKLTSDSVVSTDYRMQTGSNDILGLGLDKNGYVYVALERATDQTTGELKVFKGISAPGTSWGTSHSESPVTTIDLPNGVYRGLAVSGDGSSVYVSSSSDKSVYRYVGSPTTGYAQDTNFGFSVPSADSISGAAYFDSTSQTEKTIYPNPLGMAYMDGNNLLFVAGARWFGFNNRVIATAPTESAYHFSKVWMLNAFTGEILDTINVAEWNFALTGAYNNRASGTTPGNASGYSSTYDVSLDENKNLYSQSMYGWTVEKWTFNGTLPSVVTAVEQSSSDVPAKYSLSQNYPNPFNPTTTIEFTVPRTQHVTLKLYDVVGREVGTLVNSTFGPGTFRVTADLSKFASGVYLYTLTAGDFVNTKRMTLVK